MRRFLLLVLLVASACGGGDDDASSGGGALTVREMCTGFAEAICAKTAECAPPGIPQCVQGFLSGCCPAGSDCDQPLAGSSEAQLDACVEAIEDLACSALGSAPTGCR